MAAWWGWGSGGAGLGTLGPAAETIENRGEGALLAILALAHPAGHADRHGRVVVVEVDPVAVNQFSGAPRSASA